HKIDAKRKYPIASTCHAGVDDVTEGELEHHIPNSETALGRLHEVETAQTGLRQWMIVGEFEDRHQRATLWSPSTDASLPERVNAVTLIVALPQMLEKIGVELPMAGPAEARRLRQRAAFKALAGRTALSR